MALELTKNIIEVRKKNGYEGMRLVLASLSDMDLGKFINELNYAIEKTSEGEKKPTSEQLEHDGMLGVSLPCLNKCIDEMDSIGDEFCRWKDDEDGYPTNEMEWDGYAISKDGVEKFIKFCQGNDS